jgi:hypothetical protein
MKSSMSSSTVEFKLLPAALTTSFISYDMILSISRGVQIRNGQLLSSSCKDSIELEIEHHGFNTFKRRLGEGAFLRHLDFCNKED